MANPNVDIWGSPESWINSKNFHFIGVGDPELKTAKPKTANFGDNNGTLAKGNETGKTPLDQNIDLSICPCGQDPHYSALGSIALFRNKQTVAGNKEPYFEIVRNQPCNWFLFDGTGVGLSTTYGHQRDRTNSQQRWVPDADINNNWNRLVSPFVYWQLKSILVKVEVGCITRYLGNDTPDVTWRSLNDWKQNYSSQKILDVRLKFCGISSTAGTNITYTSNSNMDTGDIGGVAILDSLADVTDYAAFGTARETTFYLIGHKISGNYYDEASTFYMCAYNMLRDTELKALSSSSTEIGWCLWSETPYSAENYDLIMSMVSCFGIPFTDKDKSTFPLDYIDEDLYLPIIDDNGLTHGEYTHGQANAENDLYDADGIRDKNYDPQQPFDPNIYSNVTSFNSLETNASLLKYYVLDKTNVEILGDDLWTICDTLSADDYDNFDGKIKDEFLTTNPIDSIISLVRYPFNVPHIFSNTKTAIQLGKSTGQAQGYRTYNITFGVDFEGVDIYPRFGDSFLDYAPYTKYELYVPFCGTVEINPGDILGHKLNLKLRVDLSTGSVIAYIMADYLVIGTAKGSCGAEQVLNGTQSATVNSNIINGLITYDAVNEQQMNQFGRAVYPTGLIKDVLDPFGTKQAFETLDIQEEQAEFNLTHIAAPVHKMGAPSPLLAWLQEFNARLMIYYPEGDVISNTIPPDLIPAAISSFGHIKGFATATPGKVSNFQTSSRQNYLRGNILADSIPCTANERSRIRALFSDGVYLPLLTT